MGITSETVAVVADGMNLFISAKNRYGSHLDYRELLDEVCGGRHIASRPRFITSRIPNIERFAQCIRGCWDVQVVSPKNLPDGRVKDMTDGHIAQAIAALIESDVDTIVLLSGDSDFAPMLQFAKHRGKRVEVAGVPGTVGHELVHIADDVHYIEENLLYAA